MARQIVLQPNGLFACWSTIIDDFIEIDMTEEEYIEMRARETYEEKKEELARIFSDYKSGFLSQQMFMNYEECLEMKRRNS